MKKIIFIGMFTGVLALQSCGESTSCSCVTATMEGLKESRADNYKTMIGPDSSTDCIEFSNEMSKLSQQEQQAAVEQQKKCGSYEELEKERELWMEYLNKSMQEEIDKAMPNF